MSKTKIGEKKKSFKGFSLFNKLILLTLICSFTIVGNGCKSSKKAAAKAKAEQEAKEKEERERRAREEREKREADEKARKEAEERERAKREPYNKLEKYFSQVANASDVDAANQRISEALNMFSSPEAPVLIIIKKTGDIIDYDKPTTIRNYLNYLKDQKKSANAIEKIEFDDNGKIKELVLITK